jgi:hypothetical protein
MIGNRMAGVIYYALAGVSAGLTLAIALEQWVWLDMRFHLGLLVPLAFLAGIVAGCIRKRIASWTGFVLLPVLISTILTVTGGNLYAVSIIVGVTFREGIGLPGMPLAVADTLVALLMLAYIVTFGCLRKGGQMQNNL